MASTRYLRFAALGDSTTVGIGDPSPAGWRGWARLLVQAMETSYGVSFCNLAASGATTSEVARTQLAPALDHRPDLASLIVGVNDTMRSTWDPARVRSDLMTCAAVLHAAGAVLLTVRFHDHGAVFGLPGVLRRPLFDRIEKVNRVYDEIHAQYGGIRVDLAQCPEVAARAAWSIDRLHPSEAGHRVLAREFAVRLNQRGLGFTPPDPSAADGIAPSWRSDLAWVVGQGAPWLGRRARDLGPWAVRLAWAEARRTGEPAGV